MDQEDNRDDVMLSSAEDLNNEMDFGMEPEDDKSVEPEDDKGEELEEEVDEVVHTEEPEEEQEESDKSWDVEEKEDTEEPEAEHEDNNWDAKEPKDEPEEPKWEPEEEPEEKPEKKHKKEKHEKKKHEHKWNNDGDVICAPAKVNRLALFWMVILTVILAGVIGMMIYAWMVYQQDQNNSASSTVSQEATSSVAVAGALEVYLSEINLNNYDSDIVIVNNSGSTVKVTGSFRHTLYINSTADMTLELKDVDIATEGAVAVMNIGPNTVNVVTSGDNKISATANKYNTVIYSDGPLNFAGNGSLAISALSEGTQTVTTKGGYTTNSGVIVMLGKAKMETPADASTQGYFYKELKNVYASGMTVVVTDNSSGDKATEFTTSADFSVMLVSDAPVKNNQLYVIDINGGVADEAE